MALRYGANRFAEDSMPKVSSAFRYPRSVVLIKVGALVRSSIVISFSGSTEGQIVKRRYKPKILGNVSWIVGSGAGISTGMGEGDREMGEGDDVGDGAGDDSGVIAWLYIVIAAICADGRRSLDFPKRAGTQRVRVARRKAKGLSECKSTSSGGSTDSNAWIGGIDFLKIKVSTR